MVFRFTPSVSARSREDGSACPGRYSPLAIRERSWLLICSLTPRGPDVRRLNFIVSYDSMTLARRQEKKAEGTALLPGKGDRAQTGFI